METDARRPMRVVIVASGEPAAADAAWLDRADLVIAADGGAAWIDRVNRRPDLLVGDLDSADAALVDRLGRAGTAIERHPADKEASDTELALEAARTRGASEIVLLGALGGGRLDHELANLLLLADASLADPPVRIIRGGTTVRVLRGGDRLELEDGMGDTVSLAGATLRVGRSRGLSNEVVAAPASVSLEDGSSALLVVHTTREEPTP
jgi:thiamine pyrophosphokinase